MTRGCNFFCNSSLCLEIICLLLVIINGNIMQAIRINQIDTVSYVSNYIYNFVMWIPDVSVLVLIIHRWSLTGYSRGPSITRAWELTNLSPCHCLILVGNRLPILTLLTNSAVLVFGAINLKTDFTWINWRVMLLYATFYHDMIVSRKEKLK